MAAKKSSKPSAKKSAAKKKPVAKKAAASKAAPSAKKAAARKRAPRRLPIKSRIWGAQMPLTPPTPKPDRVNFGTMAEATGTPDLIQVQLESFREFLQADAPPDKRKQQGLEQVFTEIFPVYSYDESVKLEYAQYELGDPKVNTMEAIRLGETYSAPLYVRFLLTEEDGVKEEDVYMGEMPLMTERGTFVVNGAERVVVSQLHRSPGICFETTKHLNGKILHGFRIIPDRGSWMEFQFDTNDLLQVFLDRRRRSRKFLATTYLRTLGWPTTRQIVKELCLGGIRKIQIKPGMDDEELAGLAPFEDVTYEHPAPKKSEETLEAEADAEAGGALPAEEPERDIEVVAKAYEALSPAIADRLIELGVKRVEVISLQENEVIVGTLRKDPATDEDSALAEIHAKVRPGDPVSLPNVRSLLRRLFFDPKRYDLTVVGRFKINEKLGIRVPGDTRTLDPRDVLGGIKYLLELKRGKGVLDDIDHLGSRRVRCVGELLSNQCRTGLARTERLVRERMTLFDLSLDGLMPSKLINPKALRAVIRDFLARSQLSQFMDQINPLAELTHKRRLSALGPGGLNRDRAGFEVRDVHPSHYGRICPIETPEGPNIGLINSLTSYARINEFGFIETPYRRVDDGRVTDKIEWLSADREEQRLIAQANNAFDKQGNFLSKRVTARQQGDFVEVKPNEVTYMDVSPKQLVSLAASLVPFLEHDDANRALMGSNMQRQGVPLLITEAPTVGTGMEEKAARDSRAVVVAEASGIVAAASAEQIVITRYGNLPVSDDEYLMDPRIVEHDARKNVRVYPLRKFMRSNANTCIHQRPLVKRGDKVQRGQIIADGPATQNGEIALGRNVLVAFMPWNGYNFEDAIVISERLVKEDIYTSIHIEEFEVEARETKLGPEEITRDIPNVGDEALHNLDHDGIIRVGAEVKPGDILVGKITPKSETELAPEERLLRAIFGEKAADVKDSSLKVPSGSGGIVMDVRSSARVDIEREALSESERRRRIKAIADQHKKRTAQLAEEFAVKLSEVLVGVRFDVDIVDPVTRDVTIPKRKKVTKTLVHRLAKEKVKLDRAPDPAKSVIAGVMADFQPRFAEIDYERDQGLERLEHEGDAEAGVIKSAKVFITQKRKLSVGDKMAGRHGNKGVVAVIVPEEDMPFLENGEPVDICLNPLGVPSRMNVGQVLETHLGIAARALGMRVATPIFDGVPEEKVWEHMRKGKQVPGFEWIGENGKSRLYDGRTGDTFEQEVVVGVIYMMKLGHLVADKIHARAVGPYSLVTQQPLGGKAQYGGQRFGEMEVWALEAYGAAYTLQELLTVKSDDVQGRSRIYEGIVKGENTLKAGTPESFNVLVKEMQALGLDVITHSEDPDEDADAGALPERSMLERLAAGAAPNEFPEATPMEAEVVDI